MKVLDYREKVEFLRLLVYGLPGAGKTWFAASGADDPRASPTLVLDCWGQPVSLLTSSIHRPLLEAGKLHIWQLATYEDLLNVYDWLTGKHIPQLEGLMPTKPKLVVIDSLTDLQQRELWYIVGGKYPSRPIRNLPRAEIQHWGQILDTMTLLAQAFCELPMHVIVTCLEQPDVPSPTMRTPRRLALKGQGAFTVPSKFDAVMWLTRERVGGGNFNVGHFAKGTSTKSQVGVFPAVLSTPTVPKLLDLLGGTPMVT